MAKNFLIFLVFFLLIPFVVAEEKYTREKSEELMHLIQWYDYGPDAFQLALDEKKPIFLLISAPSWCYWCHVYESEDYLFHPELYPYIDENFIPIFVDSDKRPDLTKKYLEGGWPSTTIFSPDIRRINGFSGPREPLGLLKYFKSVVVYLSDKDFVGQNNDLNYEKMQPRIPTKNELLNFEKAYLNNLLRQFDKTYGGLTFGDLPEWRDGQQFPAGLAYLYILEQYEKTSDKKYLEMVDFTFENQFTKLDEIDSRYHLYDPVEGGFHRYSTKRDWSIPHYEKMLGDQAKLLRVYSLLSKYSSNPDVSIAVDGTVDFILEKFSNPQGGYYSSQDAYLEEEYYGHDQAGRAKIHPPFIDTTIRIDGNALMINTLISAGEEDSAKKSLDFIKQNLVGDGVKYYYDQEEKKGLLSGQSVSNAWALLAFVEGYEVFDEEVYLETAVSIADYSLENLYDWYGGGFFERNSEDVEFYAPSERISLEKNYGENAVFAYSFLKLYSITEDSLYLDVGIKTMGGLAISGSGLDDMYYAVKTSEYIRDNDLLEEYALVIDDVQTQVLIKQSDFWVLDLLDKVSQGVDLDDAPALIDEQYSSANFIFLIMLAIFAGLLSFISPCTLPVLTAFVAQGANSNRGEVLRKTLYFFLGLAVVFSIFGMGGTLLGSLFRENRFIFTRIAGTLIVIFGILELQGRGFSGFKISIRGKNPLNVFLFGAVFAIGWSACIGPILASILLLAATTGTAIKGSVLLFFYAIGLGAPLIFLAYYFDRIKNKKFWKIIKGKELNFNIGKQKFKVHSTYLISGILLILLGLLIYFDVLFSLNKYALQFSYVQKLIVGGEELLKLIFLR